ncbi:SERPINE1 mRNA-binding protein 1 isoform X2 [Procambarus clarkii]|uniref:SERPINE1 mRNA-binding protein 1 isoform X2 n=1 Tax=Procambarus clarkii TaxID=6728 RepID=UPI001E673170|nr:plasminogen activator inhibitor 1 RNA-binding protein-like isoform X2 [Procambarus clarkii]
MFIYMNLLSNTLHSLFADLACLARKHLCIYFIYLYFSTSSEGLTCTVFILEQQFTIICRNTVHYDVTSSSAQSYEGKQLLGPGKLGPSRSTGVEELSKSTTATQPRGPRSNDGRVKFSDREERNNRRNRPEGGEFRDGPPPPRFDGEGRGGMGRGRGRGMGRGRGRGRGGLPGGPDSRGKREFDRQSGMATTGVKSVDKREGSGSYNWGSDKDQIEEQLNATPTASDLDTSAENVEKAPEDVATATENEEVVREDDGTKEMTLDEWKAMQGARNKPAFNIRRPGEGENTAQWKKTYILKKKVEEDSDEEEEDEEEEVHHGRRKVLLDIDFQFADSPGRGRGRGRGRGGPGRGRGGDRMERGGGRGGGGMERGRGERGRGGPGSRGGRGMSRQEAPKMDDERDFPSLG